MNEYKLMKHEVASDTTTLHRFGTAVAGRPDLVPVGTQQDHLLAEQGLVRQGVPTSYTDKSQKIEYPKWDRKKPNPPKPRPKD